MNPDRYELREQLRGGVGPDKVIRTFASSFVAFEELQQQQRVYPEFYGGPDPSHRLVVVDTRERP